MTAFGVNPLLTAEPPNPAGRPDRPGRRPRRRNVVENDDYTAFVRRILTALGRRVANGDVEALPLLAGLADDIDQALDTAIAGLRGHGYSWTEIANRLGITRQAAHQRWASSERPDDTRGGAR